MLVEVQIECLLIDTVTDQPVIMLQETNGTRAVPIVIGLSEAGAIASELEQISFPRPMTHDLLRAAIEQLGGTVEAVVIHDLRASTFYAHLVVRQGEATFEIDARPSDAIAVAVRTTAPIYVSESVVDHVAINQQEQVGGENAISVEIDTAPRDTTVPSIPADTDPEQLRQMLENLSPDDFGKYKM